MCDLDESKGHDIGSTYKHGKAATTINPTDMCKNISIISNDATDTSYQDADIYIYMHSCHKDKRNVDISEVATLQKADAATLCNVMAKGVKKLF